MRILIIGSGGREHAIAEAYAKSQRVIKIYVAPGNDFMEETSSKIHAVSNIGVLDFKEISKFAIREKIDLVDVAQDDPIAIGLVDELSKIGIPAFGPTKKASEIEWNKSWSRDIMKKYKLPVPKYFSFNNEKDARKFIEENDEQLFFVKASGLASGKGVIKANTKEEAINAVFEMKRFGRSGNKFLIEEGLTGEEFSLFALCDGKDFVVLNSAQDHKTLLNHDEGPNTGGMGCNSPAKILSNHILREVQKNIFEPILKGMHNEDRSYDGILYLGGILTKKGVRVIEFNARWGDPEAQVILPGLQKNYIDLVESVMMQNLDKTNIKFDRMTRVSIAGCSNGYPGNYSNAKNKKIYGLKKAMGIPGVKIYGAGIKRVDGKNYITNGGRVFHVVAEGKNILQARERAHAAISHIYIEGNNLHYRTDIGWKEVERQVDSAE